MVADGPRIHPADASGAPTLRALELSKQLGGRTVVDRVELEVRPSEVVGLLGPNGAGKTTLFKMLMGLLPSDGGSVMLGSSKLDGVPPHGRARLGMGYLPQHSSVFVGLTVADNIAAVLELQGRTRAEALPLLQLFGLEGLRAQKAASLSGGERRRLELARLLATRPRVVLLDEPLKGLDAGCRRVLTEAIRELARQGRGVLITDHAVEQTLALCNRVYVLVEGRVAASGPPDELAAKEAALLTQVSPGASGVSSAAGDLVRAQTGVSGALR
jgi:lipopolysaccharide export system ATP-binding protein